MRRALKRAHQEKIDELKARWEKIEAAHKKYIQLSRDPDNFEESEDFLRKAEEEFWGGCSEDFKEPIKGDDRELYGIRPGLFMHCGGTDGPAHEDEPCLVGDASSLIGYAEASIYGDLSGLEGVITGDLEGDCTGVYGDVTGVSGDLDLCKITKKQRKERVNINDLIELPKENRKA